MTLRRRPGFTLLELLIAIAIVGTIFAMVHMTFTTTIMTKEIVEEGNELYGMARLAMDRMTRELSMAFLRTSRRQDEQDYTLFVGEDRESEGYPLDTLNFTSVSHIRFGAGTPESDQNEITYYVLEDNENEERVLMYREDPVIDSDNFEGGFHFKLCESLYGINFRYWDSEQEDWVDEWDSREIDSSEAGLPRAVEITLLLRGPQAEELIFQSKVLVNE